MKSNWITIPEQQRYHMNWSFTGHFTVGYMKKVFSVYYALEHSIPELQSTTTGYYPRYLKNKKRRTGKLLCTYTYHTQELLNANCHGRHFVQTHRLRKQLCFHNDRHSEILVSSMNPTNNPDSICPLQHWANLMHLRKALLSNTDKGRKHKNMELGRFRNNFYTIFISGLWEYIRQKIDCAR